MNDMEWNELTRQMRDAVRILIDAAQPRRFDILVVGCSTSETLGRRIGSASSEEAAKALMDGLLTATADEELYLAIQGCEHINRSLCVERACMERYGLPEVWVQPWLHAGGAFITEATQRFGDPVMVESLLGQASLGMDIGGTLIGMHLHPVVVPVHTDMRKLGEATLVLARTRPKYVGGPRAHYAPVDNAHK